MWYPMPKRQVPRVIRVINVCWRPLECFQKPLRRRVDVMRQFNGQMRNWASGKMGIAQGPQQPYKTTGCSWDSMNQDIYMHFVPHWARISVRYEQGQQDLLLCIEELSSLVNHIRSFAESTGNSIRVLPDALACALAPLRKKRSSCSVASIMMA